MIAPGGDGAGTRDRSSTSAHRDWAGLGGVEVPVAALPGVARSPAPHRAIPKARALVLIASRNAGRGREAADWASWIEDGATVESPVAELPELVRPHTLQRPVGGEAHTGMGPAG